MDAKFLKKCGKIFEKIAILLFFISFIPIIYPLFIVGKPANFTISTFSSFTILMSYGLAITSLFCKSNQIKKIVKEESNSSFHLSLFSILYLSASVIITTALYYYIKDSPEWSWSYRSLINNLLFLIYFSTLPILLFLFIGRVRIACNPFLMKKFRPIIEDKLTIFCTISFATLFLVTWILLFNQMTRLTLDDFFTIYLIPPAEEMLFRALFFSGFAVLIGETKYKFTSSVILAFLNGILFSLSHINVDGSIDVVNIALRTCFPILLAFAYLQTKDIFICIVAHFINNAAVGLASENPFLEFSRIIMIILLGILVISFILSATKNKEEEKSPRDVSFVGFYYLAFVGRRPPSCMRSSPGANFTH